jgi:hypothetical protein
MSTITSNNAPEGVEHAHRLVVAEHAHRRPDHLHPEALTFKFFSQQAGIP